MANPQRFNKGGPNDRKPHEKVVKAHSVISGLELATLQITKRGIEVFLSEIMKKSHISPGLFFQRLVPVHFEPPLQKKTSELRGPYFARWIKEIWKNDTTFWGEICETFYERTQKIIQQLESQGWTVYHDVLSTTQRLVVGLGQTNFWEVGMTWHRPSGLPYIPGSALKGITRASYLEPYLNKIISENMSQNKEYSDLKSRNKFIKNLQKLINDTENERFKFEKNNMNNLKENERFKPQILRTIFGSQDFQSHVVFFDAFPTEPPKFDVDIMNVHYANYYQNQGEADDTDNPNPITFLVVEPNSKFQFAVAVRPDFYHPSPNPEIGNWVWETLLKALAERGVGAKTRLGYGRFNKK